MNSQSSHINRIKSGTLAGVAATVPMTMAMLTIKASLPFYHQQPFPPQQIIEDVARKFGLRRQLDKSPKQPLVWTAHHAYGGAMGAAFGAINPSDSSFGKRVLQGVGFGIGVWAANYLVGLPALRTRASIDRQSRDRNEMMIVSHLVWGAVLGGLYHVLQKRTQRTNSEQ